MITIFKTGDIEYPDIKDIDKPVRYTMENLLEVASRTSKIDIPRQLHSRQVAPGNGGDTWTVRKRKDFSRFVS